MEFEDDTEVFAVVVGVVTASCELEDDTEVFAVDSDMYKLHVAIM